MAQENPYAAFLARTHEGYEALEDLRQRALGGRVPEPEELREARRRAHANVQALAAFLGIEADDQSETAVDQAGLEAYEQAMNLCMDLTRFSLDLTRAYGPAYLVLPGDA